MTPDLMVIWIASFFGMVVIGVVALFVLSVFFDSQSETGMFANQSFAANATNKASEGLYNFFGQLPNVGKLAGVALIIGVLGLMGIGGYYGYQRLRG